MKKTRRSLLAGAAFLSAVVLVARLAQRGPGGDAGGPGRVATIAEIQGASHVSPLAGRQVIDVRGVVTAVRENGFFFEDPQGDNRPETSEGLFVFTAREPEVRTGDQVLVGGRVIEYYPGGEESGNLPTTQIGWADVRVVASGDPLPPPVNLAAAPASTRERSPPDAVIENDAGGGRVDVPGILFDPEEDALDFFESLEGMRVRVERGVVVGPLDRFGEMVIVLDGASQGKTRSASGGILLAPDNPNPERLAIDDRLVPDPPRANVGDRLANLAGVVDYSFGSYKILNTAPLRLERVSRPPRVAVLKGGERALTVASYNVFNLHPGDAARVRSIGEQVVRRLGSPDIIALQEMQDRNGRLNDDVVAGDETFAALVEAIARSGGPPYAFAQIDPEDDADGGEPGGNIRVGYLYRPDRAVMLDRFDTAIFRGAPELRGRRFAQAGRLDAGAFAGGRKPLVAAFRFAGETIVLVNVHLQSKRGSPPLFGRVQPAVDPTGPAREAQAKVVKALVERLLQATPRGRVVVLGDFNENEFGDALQLLSGTLVNLTERLAPEERYTYIYRGNSEALDHILVTDVLAAGAEYEAVHINADFAGAPSDHDPVLARFVFR